MGERKRKLTAVLNRDGYKCGIHLGGCGESLTANTADIGHIVPRVVLRHSDENGNIHFDSALKQSDVRRDRALRDWNIQPMHPSCNQKMGAEYPPLPIEVHCRCCDYMFVSESPTPGPHWYLRPVIGLEFDKGRKLSFIRATYIRGRSVRIVAYFSGPFVAESQNLDGSWVEESRVYMMDGSLRNGDRYTGLMKGKNIGNVITLEHMILHNLTSCNPSNSAFLQGAVPRKELQALNSLPWGVDENSPLLADIRESIANLEHKPVITGVSSKPYTARTIRGY